MTCQTASIEHFCSIAENAAALLPDSPAKDEIVAAVSRLWKRLASECVIPDFKSKELWKSEKQCKAAEWLAAKANCQLDTAYDSLCQAEAADWPGDGPEHERRIRFEKRNGDLIVLCWDGVAEDVARLAEALQHQLVPGTRDLQTYRHPHTLLREILNQTLFLKLFDVSSLVLILLLCLAKEPQKRSVKAPALPSKPGTPSKADVRK